MADQPTSKKLFEIAQGLIPGGVNSPVRAFKGVGGTPPFIRSAKGCRVTDEDGKEYIDYVGSWGPMIVGHAHPQVVEALRNAVEQGTSFGAPTRLEVELAEMIVDAVPSIEKVRMVNSGTESTMSALRLARGFTGRDKIIKFTGCYHGHGDSLLVKAGSGVETLGMPDSPGVPADLAQHTVSLHFNGLQTVTDTCKKIGDQVAAIIVEPIVGNMGVLIPQPEFLPGLREVCNRHGIVLIFDEVMTGFRVALGGAQELYGVMPDLTCLGKVIGGGLPVGAYGGKNEIMSKVAPEGPVYQAGTLSGNPLAMTAGIETVKLLKAPGVYPQLDDMAKRLSNGIMNAAKSHSIPVTGNRVGSMLSLFFTEGPVFDYDTAKTSDTGIFLSYFHQMLNQRIYLAPSQFEAGFISLAHTEQDIDQTIKTAETIFQSLV